MFEEDIQKVKYEKRKVRNMGFYDVAYHYIEKFKETNRIGVPVGLYRKFYTDECQVEQRNYRIEELETKYNFKINMDKFPKEITIEMNFYDLAFNKGIDTTEKFENWALQEYEYKLFHNLNIPEEAWSKRIGYGFCVSYNEIIRDASRYFKRFLDSFYKDYLDKNLQEKRDALVAEGKAYYKGGKFYEYKENSRAMAMRKSRLKNKRPSYVSPDYTCEMYDIIYERDAKGKKVRNGKKKYILNKEKRDNLLFKIEYQMKIKRSTIIFFDKRGYCIEVDKFENFKEYVMLENIDLSKGIYARQYYHLDLSTNNVKFKNYSDKGLYLNAIKHMKKSSGSKIKARDILGNILHIKDLKDLKNKKDIIDWDNMVYWYSTTPVKKNTNRWNEELKGYWLMLPKLCDEEKVSDYSLKVCISKPIRNSLITKFLYDRAVFRFSSNKEFMDNIEKNFNTFSYNRASEFLSNIKKVISTMKKYFIKDITEDTKTIIDNICENCFDKSYWVMTDTISDSNLNYIYALFMIKIMRFFGFKKEDIFDSNWIIEFFIIRFKFFKRRNKNEAHEFVKDSKMEFYKSLQDLLEYKKFDDKRDKYNVYRNTMHSFMY
jgi:hypothetical protein